MPDREADNYEGVTIMKIKLNVIFTIVTILFFLQGFGLILATHRTLAILGIDENPASIHFARGYGSALFALGVMTWRARNSGPSSARFALIVGLSLFFLVSGIVDAVDAMAGRFESNFSWFSAAIWFMFFLLFIIGVRPTASESYLPPET